MAKKKPEGHISKPTNKFLLFRSDTLKGLKARDTRRGRALLARQHYSGEAAALWKIAKKEQPEVEAKYTALAEQVLAEHKSTYPQYWLEKAQKKAQKPARKRAHAPRRPPVQDLHTAAGHATTARPHGCDPPRSLPDLLPPSSTSSSAQTTPGPSTPYGAFGPEPSEGQLYSQQASAQGNRYESSEAEQYQVRPSLSAHWYP